MNDPRTLLAPVTVDVWLEMPDPATFDLVVGDLLDAVNVYLNADGEVTASPSILPGGVVVVVIDGTAEVDGEPDGPDTLGDIEAVLREAPISEPLMSLSAAWAYA